MAEPEPARRLRGRRLRGSGRTTDRGARDSGHAATTETCWLRGRRSHVSGDDRAHAHLRPGPVGTSEARRGCRAKGQDPALLVSVDQVSGPDPQTLRVFRGEMSSRMSPSCVLRQRDQHTPSAQRGTSHEETGERAGTEGSVSPVRPNESEPFLLDSNLSSYFFFPFLIFIVEVKYLFNLEKTSARVFKAEEGREITTR